MSITDELRKYALGWDERNRVRRDLTAIADCIDAEHERAEQDLIDANNQMEQLCECSVELPKDADDVPWNVGDRDEDCNVVIELRLTSDGWFVITDGEWPYRPDPYRPERKRHYHEPTVEDVLREFADLVRKERVELATIGEDAIAEYASKLRLAEREDA